MWWRRPSVQLLAAVVRPGPDLGPDGSGGPRLRVAVSGAVPWCCALELLCCRAAGHASAAARPARVRLALLMGGQLLYYRSCWKMTGGVGARESCE